MPPYDIVPHFPDDDKCESVSCYFLWLFVAFLVVAACSPVVYVMKCGADRVMRRFKKYVRRRNSLRKPAANIGKSGQYTEFSD